MSKVKSVIVKFRDGKKEVTVGDTVYSVANQHNPRSYNTEITAIGNKYITCGREQYRIDNGQMKTEYSGARLYSSEKAYNDMLKGMKYQKAFKEIVNNMEPKHYNFWLGCVEKMGLNREFEEALKKG